MLAPAALAAGQPPPPKGPVVVKAVHDRNFGYILADTSSRTLYLLSSEGTGKFTCNNLLCEVFWPPLTVPSGTTRVSGGPGVAGRLGLVKRPDGTIQVTDNGWPLYRYAGDHSAGQTSGDGISSFGGTWYLVRAGAVTSRSTRTG